MVQDTKQRGFRALSRFFLFEDQELSALVWLLGMYIVLVPSITLLPSVGHFNEKRALQIGVLIIVGGALLFSRRWRQRWLVTFRKIPSGARRMLGLVLSFGLLSSALAPAPFYAFLEVSHYFLLFVLAGVVATVVQPVPKQATKIILGFVVVSGLLYTIYFSVGYAKYVVSPDVNAWAVPEFRTWGDNKTNFANIRFFNHYQTLTLPLLAGGVLALPKRLRCARWPLFGIVVLWWSLIFASNVRGTILAVIVATVGIGLLFRSRAKEWVLVQASGFLLGLAVYYLLFSAGSVPPVAEKASDASTYFPRLQHWQTCLEMTWAHPLLGAGPMHYAWPPYHYMITASPHNALMQWLAEWGIPSTVIMTGLTIWGGWSWMEQERNLAECASTASNVIRVSLVATMLAGAAHSMVSGLIVAPLSQMFLVLVAGWVWGRYQSHHKIDNEISSSKSHSLLCGLLIASVVVVGSSFRDLSSATDRQVAFLNSVERNRLSPRYWTQGYIDVRDSTVIERAEKDR